MNDRTKTSNDHDRALAQNQTEGWTFLLEAARDIRTTGAIAPSSQNLARLMTEPVRAQEGRPLNIMEVGAGTGSVTRALIPQLSADCRLDIVEANPRFADRLCHLVDTHLHKQFQRHLHTHRHTHRDTHRDAHRHTRAHLPERVGQVGQVGQAGQVRVHQAYVEQLKTTRQYDVIVSGLPFANFTPGQVDTIMRRYLELLNPGGVLTYFAYRGTRMARSLLTPRKQARRHHDVAEVLTAYQRRYATDCWTVWGNLPPAKVWQLRCPAGRAPGPSATPGDAGAGSCPGA
jgi:phosphatidylethanolamine/phosphatidyl-N-methylethanolamine N-methyltransferase